jgi:hypothetical protein
MKRKRAADAREIGQQRTLQCVSVSQLHHNTHARGHNPECAREHAGNITLVLDTLTELGSGLYHFSSPMETEKSAKTIRDAFLHPQFIAKTVLQQACKEMTM